MFQQGIDVKAFLDVFSDDASKGLIVASAGEKQLADYQVYKIVIGYQPNELGQAHISYQLCYKLQSLDKDTQEQVINLALAGFTDAYQQTQQ